ITPKFGALRVAVLCFLDLAAHGRDQHVTPELDAGVLERGHRLDVTRKRTLHVRDAKAVETAVAYEGLRLKSGHACEPRLAAGVRGVHGAVEHQRLAAAASSPGAEHVRASVFDLLPLHLQLELLEELAHPFGHALLVAGEAMNVDQR